MTLAVKPVRQGGHVDPGPKATLGVQGRIQSLDVLRGLVMVIMALDHIRDFLHVGAQHFSPEDLTQTSVLLFFTRWITHFCAPVFVFLAGMSAYLSARRGKNTSTVARLLWTRGVWLLIVEMTFIQFGASFNLSYDYLIWQVIWAIGWSMIALSLLIFLPWPAILGLSLTMIAVHNAFDSVRPEQFGAFSPLWKVLHVGFSAIQLGNGHVALVIYPLVPWIGVMAAGYCFGRVMDLNGDRRRRLLLQVGAALSVGFIVLRLVNGYGDPSPWTLQPSPAMTLLSFLRTTKYPPSLAYLMMTLGPAIMALAVLDNVSVGQRNALLVFGRVPFFYYIVHWYVLHLVALGLAWTRYGRFDFMFGLPPALLPTSVGYPSDYGYDLWVVYVVWAAIVFGLYFVCAWFAGVKARHRSVWLNYL